MKRPNFFIVGAPKCGTTSLAIWLAGHPQIFMSPAKEPHFFNSDDRRSIQTVEGYEALFRDAGDQHIAVGEASVWYLYSQHAIRNIVEYAPNAKFILMLRNPVEMAPALHEEMLFTGNEDVEDFSEAWALQDERRQGRRLPKLCWEPRRLLYGEACRLGLQSQRLFSLVPRERVLVIYLQDLRRDARAQYRRVLEFLDAPDDGRTDFPNHNPAKARRWPILPRIANLAIRLKQTLGIEGGLGVWRRIDAANRINRDRAPIAPAIVSMLERYFAPDIRLLEKVVGADLRHWVA